MANPRDGRRIPERRDQILDAAQDLFLKHGLAGVTTRQIARAVGISQPSLYAHFPTREALALALCERAFNLLAARLRDVAERTEGWDRLHELGRAYIRFGLEHPAAYRVAFMAELLEAHSEPGQKALSAGLEGFMVLRRAYGELQPDPHLAELGAQSMWASIHGLVSLLLARPDFPFAPWDELIDHHLASVFDRPPGGGR